MNNQSLNLKHLSLATLAGALAIGSGSSGAQAQAAASAPAQETNRWETTAAAGVTLTRGNSKTLLATANILSLRKWEQNEVRLGADAAYGENNSIKNNESIHGFGQYNRMFTDRFYGYARVDALHDGIADVEYRVTLSPGVGYYFIKNDRIRLSAEAGPAVIFEKQGGNEKTYVALRVAERFEYKLSDRAKIWQTLEYLPQVDRFKNYIVNGEVGVEAGLTGKLSLRAWVQDTYDNEPAAGRLKNDIKLFSGVAYKF
jgi:putative salt-induced outer membrane protein YdiY